MEFTKPKVFVLAETAMDFDALSQMLAAVGAEDWTTDAIADAEALAEVAGRFCYRSFAPGLNPNVTRVREGNHGYLGNILAQGHGSVIEHGHVSFACLGVSRIVTHELVRHRLANYSQESLRFVRLDKLMMYYPDAFGEAVIGQLFDALPLATKDQIKEDLSAGLAISDEEARRLWVQGRVGELADLFKTTVERLEEVQVEIAEMLRLDQVGDFGIKKKVTSAMRRLAPEGLGTAIIMTTNHRQWRDIIEKRTSRHAEEEIRVLFSDIAKELFHRYPAFYQDKRVEMVDGLPEITFVNRRA
jgi:thymidylate synthase (FAD)